jgi:hypothetical protein
MFVGQELRLILEAFYFIQIARLWLIPAYSWRGARGRVSRPMACWRVESALVRSSFFAGPKMFWST